MIEISGFWLNAVISAIFGIITGVGIYFGLKGYYDAIIMWLFGGLIFLTSLVILFTSHDSVVWV